MQRQDLPAEMRNTKSTIFGNIELIHRFHATMFFPDLQQQIVDYLDAKEENINLGKCSEKPVDVLRLSRCVC